MCLLTNRYSFISAHFDMCCMCTCMVSVLNLINEKCKFTKFADLSVRLIHVVSWSLLYTYCSCVQFCGMWAVGTASSPRLPRWRLPTCTNADVDCYWTCIFGLGRRLADTAIFSIECGFSVKSLPHNASDTAINLAQRIVPMNHIDR